MYCCSGTCFQSKKMVIEGSLVLTIKEEVIDALLNLGPKLLLS